MAEMDAIETSEQCEIKLECTHNSHPFQNRTVTINSGHEVLVGRCHKDKRNRNEEESNLIFDNRILSRSHATLFYQNGKLYLKDLCSANGTYVNGENIGPERADMSDPKGRELKTGDILRFGKLRSITKPRGIVGPIEAKLTIKYSASSDISTSEQPKENMISPSNYTPYEGRQLDQTKVMEKLPKDPSSTANKELEMIAQTKSVNISERGTETERVPSSTISTQVLPDELEKKIECDNCATLSSEFYKYRKRALFTFVICLLIITLYQQYLNFF
ncbi:uncharacterized protein LOC128718425 [Anopheles marshallii]|uniref:uncharacterized protein LOC128718425 n=1 Tax=Anopheles marshallii TaxID=1521116 RepID=UPI00237B614B|nr:uncharacterized protein LOC128718425 [Anopheles marshallii]